ncbi:MAG: SDR family oxidoreductase [Parcubacteria group bacterium]
MAKILITGVSGMLGSNLAYAYRDHCQIIGVYLNNKVEMKNIQAIELNLLDSFKLNEIVKKFNPDAIIHCAALVNVDKCEEDKDAAYELNVRATRNVAQSLSRNKTKLVYISTDAVYNGVKGHFQEGEEDPVNHYGRTKLLGEREALQHDNALVLRTNIFGLNVRNKLSFGEWILDSLMKGNNINGFTDAIFSTIYTFCLSNILEKCLKLDLRGIYNVGSSDCLSKYDFMLKVAQKFNLDQGLIGTSQVNKAGLTAKRGANLCLNMAKIENALGQTMPAMEDSINAFHRDCQNNIFDK